mgnify:CR=1 FL=1
MAERRRGLGRGIGALIPSAQRESKDRPIDVFFGSGVTSASHEIDKGPSSKPKKAKKSATPKTADDSKAGAAVEPTAKAEEASKKSPGKRSRLSSDGDSLGINSSSPRREKSEATGKEKDFSGGRDADAKKDIGRKKDADKDRSSSRKTVVGGTATIENSAVDKRADAGAKAVNADAKASSDFEEASRSEMEGKATSQDANRPATQRARRTGMTTNAVPGSTDEFAEATAKSVKTVVERTKMKTAELEPVGAVVKSAESEPAEPKDSAGNEKDSAESGTREGLNQSPAVPDGEMQTSPADSRGSEGMHPNSAVQHKTSVRAFDQAGAVEFSEEIPSVDVRQNKTKDSKSSASRDSSTPETTGSPGGQEAADSASRPVVAGADASNQVDVSGQDGHSRRAEASEARGDVGNSGVGDKPEAGDTAETGNTAGAGDEPEAGDAAEAGDGGVADAVESVRLVKGDGGDAESGGGTVLDSHVEDNGEAEANDAVAKGSSGDDVLAEGASRAQNEQDEADEGLVEVPGATYAELPLDQIIPNTRQPRNVFDEEELEELAASIREVGVLQPVIVRPLAAPIPGQPKARYELIMGERRWRASELAGIETAPAIIRHTQDEDLLRDALLENLHRAELNPLEEAAAYQQLLEDFQCTQEELSRRIVRSRPQISNTLRLLKLPPLVQRRVAAGVLSSGHARALLGLSDPGAMERLAQKIVSEGLSVRQVEEIVALGDEPTASPTGGRRRARRYGPELGELSSRLADRFDTRVKVEMGAKKGSIKIDFASIDDLNRILGVLSPGETGVDVAE